MTAIYQNLGFALQNGQSRINPCYYCGEMATTVDHVVPLSRVRDLSFEELYQRWENDRLTCPACGWCNAKLHNSIQGTLLERFHVQKGNLQRSLASDLSVRVDTRGMTGGLLRMMRKAKVAKAVAERRIAWPAQDIALLPPDQSVSQVLKLARDRRMRLH